MSVALPFSSNRSPKYFHTLDMVFRFSVRLTVGGGAFVSSLVLAAESRVVSAILQHVAIIVLSPEKSVYYTYRSI